MFRLLVLVFCGVQAASAVTHSWRAFYTGTTGLDGFPEFVAVNLVDEFEVGYFDSRTSRFQYRQPWMEQHLGQEYLERQTNTLQGWQPTFKANVKIAMERFNQTGGVHTFQFMYGCELDSDGTTRGSMQFGYDGADFIALDTKTLTWTAAHPKAVITKNKWDTSAGYSQSAKAYLENTCIEWVKKYVDYGRETLLRTERPQVSVYSSVSGSQGPEVTCLATGFFPKDIVVHLQRDGQDLQEDVQSGEVLPNGDGSFQVRKSLRVSEEELKRHQYSCRVDHTSLREDIVKNMEPKSEGGFPIGIIVGVVVGVLVLIAVVGIVIWRRRQTGYGKASTSDSDSNSSNNPPAKA